MVYLTDKMPTPIPDGCRATFDGIINNCIVEHFGKNDDMSANLNEEFANKVAQDPTQTVYRLGSDQGSTT